jgi:hypothetical protein
LLIRRMLSSMGFWVLSYTGLVPAFPPQPGREGGGDRMIVATRQRSPAPRGKDHDNQILMRRERFPEEKAVWLRLRRVD